MKTFALTLIVLFVTHGSFSQNDSNKTEVKINGFVDSYYIHDFGNPFSNRRPGFLYSHTNPHEIAINMAMIGASVKKGKMGMNLGFMAGTYPKENLSHEPDIMQNIWEANVTYKFCKNAKITAGVFPSHIGFESAISIDNYTLTRSLIAENSPYYLAGTKLEMQINDKLFAGITLANGWQNIKETSGNRNKGLGTQITYAVTENLSLNSSTFFSNEQPYWKEQWRFFHDFYVSTSFKERFHIIGGFDYGMEENTLRTSWNHWWGSCLILHADICDQIAAALRIESYQDEDEIIFNPNYRSRFFINGASVNLDWKPVDNLMFRVEGRTFNSPDPMFLTRHFELLNVNHAIYVSLAAKI